MGGRGTHSDGQGTQNGGATLRSIEGRSLGGMQGEAAAIRRDVNKQIRNLDYSKKDYQAIRFTSPNGDQILIETEAANAYFRGRDLGHYSAGIENETTGDVLVRTKRFMTEEQMKNFLIRQVKKL